MKELARVVGRRQSAEEVSRLLAQLDGKLRGTDSNEQEKEAEEEDACVAARTKAMEELLTAKRSRREARFAKLGAESKVALLASLRGEVQAEMEKVSAAETAAAEIPDLKSKYEDLSSAAATSLEDLDQPAVEVDLYLGGENVPGETRRLPKFFSEVRKALGELKAAADAEAEGGAGDKLGTLTAETLPAVVAVYAQKDSDLGEEENTAKASGETATQEFEEAQAAEADAEKALSSAENECKAGQSLLAKRTARRRVEADAVEVAMQLLRTTPS